MAILRLVVNNICFLHRFNCQITTVSFSENMMSQFYEFNAFGENCSVSNAVSVLRYRADNDIFRAVSKIGLTIGKQHLCVHFVLFK